jgi:hypothetical protein
MHKIGDIIANPWASIDTEKPLSAPSLKSGSSSTSSSPPDSAAPNRLSNSSGPSTSASNHADQTLSSSSNFNTSTPIVFRRCKLCQKIYPKHEEQNLICDRGITVTDFYGEQYSMHERDPKFDFNGYVAGLSAGIGGAGMGWKDIFWR